MRKYVSLHNHTTGSIGSSTITPKELISGTKEAGQTAVAITDHGSLFAVWETYKAAKAAGIKLIVGCECYFVDDSSNPDDTNYSHLVFLAKNEIGYSNLLKLNKRGFDDFSISFKKAIPRIDWKKIEEFKEGLICTSACGNGLISQYIMRDQLVEAESAAKRLQDIFGDDFTLELQPHNLQRRPSPYSGPVNQQKINMALKSLGQKLGIRCIVATDAHYLNKEDHKKHDVYLAINSGQPITSGNRLIYDKHDFYIKTSDQVYQYFERHIKMWGDEFVASLFENTIYYADKCENPDWVNLEISTGEKSQLPDFPVKDESDYQEFLKWKQNKNSPVFADVPEDAQFYRYRSELGLLKKIKENKIPKEDYDYCIAQMLEEFDVFEFRNFSSYMLISADFLNWCQRNDISIGPGRGSVGGSLTAYCNGIHKIYPKRYGLIFARFLNKYKDSPPDIDNDIAPSGRSKLHDYLRFKYGEKNVAQVSNINTIKPKVYAKDISRVFDFGGQGRSVAAEIGNNIADSLPDDVKTIKKALMEAPLFAEYAKQYPELEEYASLCGLPRALSTHAGGIVVSKKPLEGLTPLRRDTSGALVLEHDKSLSEENGLVKIDVLGLETLDIITETYKLINDSGKKTPDVFDCEGVFDYEKVGTETYDLISSGNTMGVFQLGSTAVPVCKGIKPKSLDDIALITALVRPSSMASIPEVVDIRDGKREPKILDKSLERSFGNTYGVGLYEESLLFLAGDFSNWNLNEADKLRKLTKAKGKDPEKAAKWREEFIEGAIGNGFSREFAEEVWETYVEVFQGYGFSRSLYFLEPINIYTLDGSFLTTKPIQDVQPGEFVRSRDEVTGEDIYIEVIGNHDHGELEVFEVELETGERVRCTMNHKFRTVETGEMLPLHQILEQNLSIVVR